MKQLRILKIHHNPLNWPPSHIIEPIQDADGSAWLDQLKQYLRENSNTVVDTTTEKQGKQDILLFIYSISYCSFIIISNQIVYNIYND
jgi:hypothetical protein